MEKFFLKERKVILFSYEAGCFRMEERGRGRTKIYVKRKVIQGLRKRNLEKRNFM